MSPRSPIGRSRMRRKARRGNHGQVCRRLCFEAFEDRHLLSFTPGTIYPTGAIGSWDLVTADFNNDGHLDLVTQSTHTNKVSLLLGDGLGGFGAATLFDVGNLPHSMAVGDFNEDDMLDLVAANQGDFTPSALPSVSVLLGNGDGMFESAISLPSFQNALSVAVGDFNDDGHLDLGVGSAVDDPLVGYLSWASVYMGDGAGYFAEPVTSAVDARAGVFESAIAADLNGDGVDDLVFGDVGYGGVFVYLGGDASGFLQLSEVLIDNTTVEDVAVGDVNGDGALDIVTANEVTSPSHYGVSVLLGNGQGGYGAPRNYLAGHSFMMSVVLGDFTGDGHIDIAFNSGRDLGLLRGNGDGTLAAPELFAMAGVSALAAGDFNSDDWLDIAAANFNDTVSVLLNDQSWSPALVGDYNRDNSADAADYVMWRKMQSSTVTPSSGADGNGDGVVDQDDYVEWRAHFGQVLSPPAVGSGVNAAAEAEVRETTNLVNRELGDSDAAVAVRGASETQRALMGRESAFVELLARPATSPAESRVATRPSLCATAPLEANCRDDALLMWLIKPDSKQVVTEWENGNELDNDEANDSCESLLVAINEVFSFD